MEPPPRTTVASLSAEQSKLLAAQLARFVASKALPEAEIVAEADKQVETWLDCSATPQLDVNGVWEAVDKLNPLANWEMLSYAVEKMFGELANLSTQHTRLMWIIQSSLKTLTSSLYSEMQELIQKVSTVAEAPKRDRFFGEKAAIFNAHPPIDLYRKLCQILKTLEAYSGKTDEAFEAVKKSAQEMKNRTSFLLEICFDTIFTTDPEDPAHLPFVDLGDLHAYLVEKRAVYQLGERCYLEVLNSTDLRCVLDPDENWKKGKTIFTLSDLPAAQTKQVLANKAAVDELVETLKQQLHTRTEERDKALGKLRAEDPTFDEVTKGLDLAAITHIASAYVVNDYISLTSAIKKHNPNPLKWRVFLATACQKLIERCDVLSCYPLDGGFEQPFLLLARPQRILAIRAYFEILAEGGSLKATSALAPFFSPDQIHKLLSPTAEFEFLKKLMGLELKKGFFILKDFHEKFASKNDTDLTTAFQTIHSNLSAAQVKNLSMLMSKQMRTVALLFPHLDTLNDELREKVYGLLFYSLSYPTAFRLLFQMCFDVSKHAELWSEIQKMFPQSIESENITDAVAQKINQFQQLSEAITKQLPHHLQGEFNQILEEKDLSKLLNFCTQHTALVPLLKDLPPVVMEINRRNEEIQAQVAAEKRAEAKVLDEKDVEEPQDRDTAILQETFIAFEAQEQAETWLDRTKTPKLDRINGVWNTVVKLVPRANWEMLSFAIDKMYSELAVLSIEHVRLLWIIQWNLKTLDWSPENQTVKKRDQLVKEIGNLFWLEPPIELYRKLAHIVRAVKNYSGETKETFETIRKSIDDLQKSAAFLRTFFYNFITTTREDPLFDPTDPGCVPFVELAALQTYLTQTKGVLQINENTYLEPVNATDFRCVHAPTERWKAGKKVVTEGELPAEQRPQLDLSRKSLEASVSKILSVREKKKEAFKALLKELDSDPQVKEHDKKLELIPQPEQTLISFARANHDHIALTLGLMEAKEKISDWSQFVNRLRQRHLEACDQICSHPLEFRFNDFFLHLSRTQRLVAIPAFYKAIESGVSANLASALKPFFSAEEVDRILTPKIEFTFLKNLSSLAPEKGFLALKKIHETLQNNDAVENTKVLQEQIPKLVPSQGTGLSALISKQAHIATLLLPRCGKLEEEQRKALYLSLLYSVYQSVGFRMCFHLSFDLRVHAELWSAIEKLLPNDLDEDPEAKQQFETVRDSTELEGLKQEIIESLPADLQKEFQTLLEKQNEEAFKAFAQMHKDEVPKLMEFFSKFQRVAQFSQNIFSPTNMNQMLQIAKKVVTPAMLNATGTTPAEFEQVMALLAQLPPEEIQKLMQAMMSGKMEEYEKILKQHFPEG